MRARLLSSLKSRIAALPNRPKAMLQISIFDLAIIYAPYSLPRAGIASATSRIRASKILSTSRSRFVDLDVFP